MITPEVREELRRIQSELKKPFAASVHEFRDLPGGGRKWVFLKWQTIRERLDEVAPEWTIDYSEVQYLNNDAICRAGISILGVRKEAIASVPISILSSHGKEMTRGSAADRLAAEALKNAAEVWGVGRYLDDQEFTIRYLHEHRTELDEQSQGELRRLAEQYKIDKGVRPLRQKRNDESGLLQAVAGIPVPKKISEAQTKTAQDLYPANNNVIKAIRSLTKHQPDWIYSQCRHYGYDSNRHCYQTRIFYN